MGKTVIKEDMFPEIISHYNTGGRKAAYALLRERYGILHPAGVVRRIKKDGRYGYDEVKDRFEDYPACGESGEGLFLGIEELCALSPAAPAPGPAAGKHAGLEKLVQELLGDRLLLLSRYITLDSSTRTMMVDQSSLLADGYTVELLCLTAYGWEQDTSRPHPFFFQPRSFWRMDDGYPHRHSNKRRDKGGTGNRALRVPGGMPP